MTKLYQENKKKDLLVSLEVALNQKKMWRSSFRKVNQFNVAQLAKQGGEY